MAGARRGIATAASPARRLSRSSALLLVLALALLVIAGAQGQAGQTEVALEVLGSPIGAVEVTDLDASPPVSQECADGSFVICTFKYPAPRRVRLTAPVQQTESPFKFYGWSAAECPSGVNVCELDLTGDEPVVSVVPLYDPERILLSVTGQGKLTWPEPAGEQECVSEACSTTGNLPAREPVVFTATPTDSSHSIDWAFGCEPDPDNPSKCVARPENRELGVSFNGEAPGQPFDVDVTLRVAKTGNGSGKITGSDFDCGTGDGCRKLLAFGKHVTLQAEAAAGSQFDRWVGVCASNPACSFNAGPVTSVQARFVQAAAAPSPPQPQPQPPQPQPPQPQPRQPQPPQPQPRQPQPPQPQPRQPQPPQPQPPKLDVRITKLAAFRRAGRWRVTARIAANEPVRVRARVGRLRRTWGDRTVNLRTGTSSLAVQLTRRARRGTCWFVLVVRTAGGEVRTLPRRTVTLGR
jgi:Divergent InlB B-repeat domain